MENKGYRKKVQFTKLNERLNYIRESRAYKFITKSAIFGLLLTLGIFLFEQYQNRVQTQEITGRLEKAHASLSGITDNLVYVQQSLSTRYLGLFPDYLDRINEILYGAQPRDSIIIFEDVLYYGFTSKPEEFKKMNRRLIELADSGNHVTIAYYNPKGRNFKRMVLDEHIATELSAKMDVERRSVVRRERGKRVHLKELMAKDSIICDEYFDRTRAASPYDFREKVDRARKPIASNNSKAIGIDAELDSLYHRIDSVKSVWLAENYENICLHDFENMNREISLLMADVFGQHNIDLIPIDENLSISCWAVGDKAILAFPSKYATDEIGFFSQDPAFTKYIQIMLNGFKGNYSKLDLSPETNDIDES